MRSLLIVAAAAAVTLAAAPARAQHDHHGGHPPPDAGTDGDAPARAVGFELGVSVVGGRFDRSLYGGDYAGATVSGGVRLGRVGLRAAVPVYRLRKNGATIDGLGDITVAVDALAFRRGALSVGVSAGATLPTGDSMTGLGMGHPMAMPAAWASIDGARTSVGASLGWCGAIGGSDDHAHGAWPLVEPMSSSELMGDVRVERALAGRVRGVGRILYAVPLVDEPTRVVAAVGATWRGARADTGAELQAGLAGDPFTVRALVTSAVRF